MKFTELSLTISDLEAHVSKLQDIAKHDKVGSNKRPADEITAFLTGKIALAKTLLEDDLMDYLSSPSKDFEVSEIDNAERLKLPWIYKTIEEVLRDVTLSPDQMQFISDMQNEDIEPEKYREWGAKYRAKIKVVFPQLEPAPDEEEEETSGCTFWRAS